jgi:hypothetical protein
VGRARAHGRPADTDRGISIIAVRRSQDAVAVAVLGHHRGGRIPVIAVVVIADVAIADVAIGSQAGLGGCVWIAVAVAVFIGVPGGGAGEVLVLVIGELLAVVVDVVADFLGARMDGVAEVVAVALGLGLAMLIRIIGVGVGVGVGLIAGVRFVFFPATAHSQGNRKHQPVQRTHLASKACSLHQLVHPPVFQLCPWCVRGVSVVCPAKE